MRNDGYFSSEPMGSPMFAQVRRHPRFRELAQRVGLAGTPIAP
ncbi:MAG: hypothetical protein ACT4P7_18465 [Gemmatimonadaceae bacterium]